MVREGGLFAALEGIDGAGKTTAVNLAARALAQHGYRAVGLDRTSAASRASGYVAAHMAMLAELIWDEPSDAPYLDLGDEHWVHLQAAWYRAFARCLVTPLMDEQALRFSVEGKLESEDRKRLERLLRAHFPRQVASLDLSAHPALATLRDRYQGVIIMHAPAFEALVLGILSQNRTGEIVRKVYPILESRCGGISPDRLAAMDEQELASIIRPAGPYKAARLSVTAQKISATGACAFAEAVAGARSPQALAYLTSFPGVGHKTAACVRVYTAQADDTLPVDTHLFRVAHRLGLISHSGKLTTATRENIVATLLAYGCDVAPAHFLFLLVGRSLCAAQTIICAIRIATSSS